MNRSATIKNRASDLAKLAVKKWSTTGVQKYFAGFKVNESKPTEEVVDELTDHIEKILENGYPEDTYTPKLDKQLKEAKDDELLDAVSTNRSIDPRTTEYIAFKPLYNPDEGPDWYGMNQAQLAGQMRKLGYDPDEGGVEERSRFMDALRNNAQHYERVKGVEEDMSDPWNVVNSILMPSATEEAVKQSVTGQYDDAKMNRAKITDYLVGGLMNVGLSPELRLGLTGRPLSLTEYLAGKMFPKSREAIAERLQNLPSKVIQLSSTPARAAGVAGTLEATRQGMNKFDDREVNYAAPFGSALAAFTVPAAAQMLGSTIAKETDPLARVKSRGFMRGLRGIDPLKQERDNLRNQVLRAREINKSMPEPVMIKDGGPTSSGTYAVLNNQMAGTEAMQNTIEKLRALGFPLKSELDEMMKYSKDYSGPKLAGRPITVEDILGASSATGQKKAASAAEGTAMKPVSKTEKLFNKEDIYFEPSSESAYDPLDAVLAAYDSPKLYLSFQKSGQAAPLNTYKRNLLDYQRAKALFPEKTENEIMMGTNPKVYNRYRGYGKAANAVFGRIEPITRMNLLDLQNMGSNLENLKGKDWFVKEKKDKKRR